MKKINSKEDLEQFVKENPIAAVKWGAPWCGPCRILEKNISEVPSEVAAFGEVDVDEVDEELVADNHIRNIPVVQFYKNGEYVDRVVGAQTPAQLIEMAERIKKND